MSPGEGLNLKKQLVNLKSKLKIESVLMSAHQLEVLLTVC